MLNRQSFEDYDFLDSDDKYNRVVGMDYNLASEDNTWTGKFYLHKSLQPGDNKGNLSSQATLTYNSRKYTVTTDFVYVDQEFRSDMGYIPRRDVFKSGNRIERSFYPANGRINRHSFNIMSILYWCPSLDLKRTDHDLEVSWDAAFRDQSTLEVSFANRYIYLTRDFDPTRTEGALPLPGNTGYYFNQLMASYQSSMAKLLSLTAESTIGQFYNGRNASLRFGPRFRSINPKVTYWLNI